MVAEVRRKIVKWIIQASVGAVGYGAVIFLSAGTLKWLWGWILLGELVVLLAAHPLILIPKDPDLLAERAKGTRDKDVKSWDKWITSLAGGMMMLAWVVAGLDLRFEWSAPMPVALHLLGALLTLLGYGLFMWAMSANPFFAEGVRIQHERGHRVARGGPYRYVRHPGYAGAILAHLATPFLLGSPWALIPEAVLTALFLLRTALEDRTLLAELDGYGTFAAEIRYRLLPGVW